MSMECPGCGEDAPVVLRGVVTYCAACGRARPAMGNKVLGIAGQPARIGGFAAKVAAGTVFGLGTFMALLLMLVIQAIWPEGWLGYAIGAPIEFLTLLITFALYFGGRMLGKSGERTVSATRLKALKALSRQRGGVLRAVDVAKALHMDEGEADDLLTQLAKHPEEDVGIDVNEEGEVLYLIGSPDAKRFRIRVEEAGLGDAFDEAEAELAREKLRELEAEL